MTILNSKVTILLHENYKKNTLYQYYGYSKESGLPGQCIAMSGHPEFNNLVLNKLERRCQLKMSFNISLLFK